MERSFSTLEELQAEIGILRIKSSQQESAIHEKLNGPLSVFKTINSFFQGAKGKTAEGEEIHGQDFISIISRVLLPVILNKSIFRGSGFITKTLVTLFSQTAAKNVNIDLITNTIDKISAIFKHRKKDLGKKAQDYGIPPDSETY